LRNLKAREIADKAGCALGAIYNLVEDMDELVLRVGTQTLAHLDDALSKAGAQHHLNSTADAIERLVRIAVAYCFLRREQESPADPFRTPDGERQTVPT
jgi:AcrR family transcriptional regulator